MKRLFAALRFFEDPNLEDRVYWYASELPLKPGEDVLAPVGSHDCLQAARVEKLLVAEEENAPYDVRLIKRVAAKRGARKLRADGEEFLEWGGVRYDEKRYTPFGRLLLARSRPVIGEESVSYGVGPVIEGEDALERLARAEGCAVLVGGEGEALFARLYAFVRGEDGEFDRALGALLRRKLL